MSAPESPANRIPRSEPVTPPVDASPVVTHTPSPSMFAEVIKSDQRKFSICNGKNIILNTLSCVRLRPTRQSIAVLFEPPEISETPLTKTRKNLDGCI